MTFRGLAVGSVGVVNTRNAVGPSDGKMKGRWENIAMAPRIAIVIKPWAKMNAAFATPLTSRRCELIDSRRSPTTI